MNKKEVALLLIDVQQAFKNEAYWGGNRNNPEAEQNIALLLSDWRSKGWPILHVKHNSKTPTSLMHPTNEGNQFMACAQPNAGEPIFEKQVNSAFIGTQLQAYLQEQGITSLLIVGFITNHCVSTTARMAGNYGYEVYLAADATATFDRIGHDGVLYKAEDVHRISLANLHEEFATIVNTADMLTNVKTDSHVNV